MVVGLNIVDTGQQAADRYRDHLITVIAENEVPEHVVKAGAGEQAGVPRELDAGCGDRHIVANPGEIIVAAEGLRLVVWVGGGAERLPARLCVFGVFIVEVDRQGGCAANWGGE